MIPAGSLIPHRFIRGQVARLMLLVLMLTVAVGCSRTNTPPKTQTGFAYSWFGDFLADEPHLRLEAEPKYRPRLGNLVADPERGVWGSQEGELFRFLVESNGAQSRIIYGRPDPAAMSLDDLVLLSPTQLVGRVVTTHLVRYAIDGQAHDVAPARAPDGAPFDAIAERDGKPLFRSARSIWYSYDAATLRFQYAEPFKPAYVGTALEAQKRKFEQAANGYVSSVVTAAGGELWGLVDREQLFRFDLTSTQFTMLGSPVPAGTVGRPVGSVNGQLVVQSTDALILLDTAGRTLREYQTVEPWRRAFPGAAGWFYLLPQMAVNVATGEVRKYPVDVQNGTDGLRAVYGGSATALTILGDGRLAGGTGHFGSLFIFDPATGDIDYWGRPLPELGQQSGEEIAPIQGLARGSDGYLYVAVGTGAKGTEESHLVRLDTTGQVTAWTHVAESIHDLVPGADGLIYGAAVDRAVVIRYQ